MTLCLLDYIRKIKSCRFQSQQHVQTARRHNFDYHPDVGLMLQSRAHCRLLEVYSCLSVSLRAHRTEQWSEMFFSFAFCKRCYLRVIVVSCLSVSIKRQETYNYTFDSECIGYWTNSLTARIHGLRKKDVSED